jgi:hypothetical protein
MTDETPRLGVRTTAIHAGESLDPATGASAPIWSCRPPSGVEGPTAFSAHDAEDDGRLAKPTIRRLEEDRER